MDTGTKILIGAAVVIGGVVIYKVATSQPNPVTTAARATASPTGGSVGGFLGLANSIVGYLTRQQPTKPITQGSSWDSSSDLLLPLQPGHSAYEDSTSNDYLLS